MSAALEISEKELDRTLFAQKDGLAAQLGWRLNYHVLRSRGSQAGFPDRVLVRERIIFAELKREGGKPSERQVEWLDGLAKAGAEVYLWTPGDLDEIAKVLSKRWSFANEALGILAAGLLGTWTPASLWIAGDGRADAR